ncbi:hypothetical protein FDC50_02695 [Clostridium botulinum]|nr:membrane protein [Clostridium botulinum]MBY6804004.1 hypothetical protein [Clostridium botulinum]MBY6814549.1 hypothetical protein [Clostridium botulinum]MBY6821092.1 hypothetical protein [Clostridium botulinum]NFJ50238.1 hypothetical protein [Clostridium botulinum]
MEVTQKKGITSFQLKLLGLILMTFDHMGAFLAIQTPVWFGWLGRPVATIFLFVSAEGYYYSRNKKKYISRLLIGFWIMNLGNYLLTRFMPVEGVELYANIFGALFYGVLYMYLYDLLKNSIKEKNASKILLSILLLLLPFILGFLVMYLMDYNISLGILAFNIIPSPLLVEGGIMYIIMALLFHIFQDKKLLKILVILIVSIFVFISSVSSGDIFTLNYQWMMIFSIIPIYLYNGEKGKSLKYLFYMYYPFHIFTLYIISYFIV